MWWLWGIRGELLCLGRRGGEQRGNRCSAWVVDSLWRLTCVTGLVKYNTLGEKRHVMDLCAAIWNHSRGLLPGPLLNQIPHKHGQRRS